MTDHEAVRLHPTRLVAINGHEPAITHNVTTSTMRMICDTCEWLGPSRRGRRQDRIDGDWRGHAGDIAVGVTITHGEADNGCYCWACSAATRRAAEQSR